MTMDRHVEIADKLEAYALGQLTEQESRDVDAHLRECATCALELRELNAVLRDIGESVPAVDPSPAVRQRVLSAVGVEPQEPVRSERRVGVVEQPRRRVFTWIPLAAAAVLIVAVGAAAVRVDQFRRQLIDDLAQERTITVELRKRLAQYAGQTDLALSILTAADMREIPMTGSEATAIAAARAYWSPARGLLLVADRLPAPPAGRVYQVWIIKGEEKLSAGLLGDEPGGRGMLIVTPPRRGVDGSVTVAVTDEPPGGLPQPSGGIRLAGSI